TEELGGSAAERCREAGPSIGCKCAALTDALEDDVVGDGVARLSLDAMKRLLELWIGEGLDLAAVRADEMVVVLPVRLDGLVAGGGRADVQALDEGVASELLEDEVDALESDRAALSAQTV